MGQIESMRQAVRKPATARQTSGLMTLAAQARGATLTGQLFQSMRRLITEGVWRRGERIPGSRILARDASVSRTTVLATIEMLVAEGLLETRGTAGTFVAGTSADKSTAPAKASAIPLPAPNLVPFSASTPALDLFPLRVWRRLQARRWSTMPLAALDDGDDAGLLELRAAITAHLDASRGIKCGAHQIVVVSSAQSAIHLAALVLAERGAKVWTEEPGYFSAASAVRAAGAQTVPVPVDDEGLIVDEGVRLAPQAKMAIVTPACQMPLGVPMSLTRRTQLLHWARTHEAWIVEDDYASEFPAAKRVSNPLAAMASSDRVIYVNTFSKTLFPALRLAYLIVPEPLVERFIAARRGIDRNASVPNQMVLADFLNTGQFARHLRRCREAYSERRRAMVDGLAREFDDLLNVRDNLPGLHVCATYDALVDEAQIAALAGAQGINFEPLKQFYAGISTQRGLVLGFAGFTPAIIRTQLRVLAKAIRPALQQ